MQFPRVKAFVRDLAGAMLHRIGATAPQRRAAGRMVLLTFHRVLPAELRRQYPYPGLVVTPEQLDWFLDFFSRHFEINPLRETADRWQRGSRSDPPRLAVTFDDGQLDNFVYARPVLESRGIRATFFVPVDAVVCGEPLWHDRLGYALQRLHERGNVRLAEGLAALEVGDVSATLPLLPLAAQLAARAKRLSHEARLDWVVRLEALAGPGAIPAWDGHMTLAQLSALAAAGHEIGSHSRCHPILPQCNDAELEDEIAGSRRALQERLGVAIDSFCYPNGDCDARTVRAVERAGYRYAVTTGWGTNAPGAPLYRLRRNDMQFEHATRRDGSLSEARVAWRISGLHPGLRGAG